MVWSPTKQFPAIIERIRESTKSDITTQAVLEIEIKRQINLFSKPAIIRALKLMEELGYTKKTQNGAFICLHVPCHVGSFEKHL